MPEIKDFGRIGEMTADLMTKIEDTVEEDQVELELGVVGIVVEINYYDKTHDCEATMLTFRCSDPRKWIQEAIFAKASEIAGEE